ncbi:MAG: hydrogenase maturation nickel metallochaperone HypA [Armatimonadota bacterium]|nr:hydrogenase maturation nickel metallochaperone HypA [Armatimonadota bacterium]
MHELSICQALIEAAADAVSRLPAPPPRVLRVTLRIGHLTAVVPDALRFHFDLLTPGTVLEGATLDIEEVPVRGRCGACAHEFVTEALVLRCPACGAGDVQVLAGRELELVALDVADGPESEEVSADAGDGLDTAPAASASPP